MKLHEKFYAKAQELIVEAQSELAKDEPNTEKADELLAEAKQAKSQAEIAKETFGLAEEIAEPSRPTLPTSASKTTIVEDEEGDTAEREAATKAANLIGAVHVLRHGNEDFGDAKSLVMREVYDGDFRQINYEQTKAFDNYLRYGAGAPILERQVWGTREVESMLKSGMSVAEIKATMVEGQDTLGGYAVPATVSDQIIQRTQGMAAVRAAGATIVQTAGKSIEWLKVSDGGDDRYPTAMRGAWGNETKNPPSETNMTTGLINIPVNVYTFKVPMSTSLVEDASNLVSIFTATVSETLAIDEDEAFLIGLGTNEPFGLIPGSANVNSLTEVVSGSAAALTWNGLRNLRRGVATQYRRNASWVMNSDTGGDIEALQDGDTRNYVEGALMAGDSFLGATYLESEAMPDVAANSYSIVYGDFSGYAIVERLGLAVRRYNDSNTGINTVEFHVRRRVGGRVVEPWKFAVQKTASS